MAITIKKSNGQVLAINDFSIDRTYSPSLLGKSADDFGSAAAQTLFQLQENYASSLQPDNNPFVNFDNINGVSSPPVAPTVGQLWYDIADEKLKVYDPSIPAAINGWAFVSPETTELDLVPLRDAEQDIGSTERYWHNFYATNVFVNTNRFSGQEGVAHPDGIVAISIDGDTVLKNTNPNSDCEIFTEVGNRGEIGEAENPFGKVITDSVRLGNGNTAGLRIDTNSNSSIIPSAGDDSVAESIVNLGSSGRPFTSFHFTEANIDRLSSFGGNNIRLGASDNIRLGSNDTVDFGTPVQKFENVYVDRIVTSNLEDVNTVSPVAANVIFENGMRQIPDGEVTTGNSIDTIGEVDEVAVVSSNGTIKKLPYLDLVPVGFIMLWGFNLNQLPFGWAVCDGKSYTNGIETNNGQVTTPDLSRRFIYGVKVKEDIETTGTSNTISSSNTNLPSVTTSSNGSHTHEGSTANHTLTIDQIPSHRHTFNAIVRGTESDGGGGTLGDESATRNFEGNGSVGGSFGEGLGHSHGISNTGTNHTHTVNPSSHDHNVNLESARVYRAIYVMKVA